MLYSFKSTLKFNVGIWTCSNAASRVLTFPLIKTDCWFYRVWNILPVVFVNVAVLNWTELPLKLYHACVCFGARFLVRWKKRWLLFQLSYRLNLNLSTNCSDRHGDTTMPMCVPVATGFLTQRLRAVQRRCRRIAHGTLHNGMRPNFYLHRAYWSVTLFSENAHHTQRRYVVRPVRYSSYASYRMIDCNCRLTIITWNVLLIHERKNVK